MILQHIHLYLEDKMKTLKVLVVDDSALMRKMISDILNEDAHIEVIDAAHNGKDALIKVEKYRPDVITMDVEMPVMNGIEAVKEIMKSHPTPIIMVSALTRKGADITMDALHYGAIDFVYKPSGSISTDIKTVGDQIIQKVKSAGGANIISPHETTPLHSIESISSGSTTSNIGKKIHTLLVDDSPFFIKTTQDILNEHPDIKIVGIAANGMEAVEKYNDLHPDVVLMDLDMPVMSGLEATYKILKQSFVPIVLFSSKTDHDMKDVKLALEVGAVDFLAKPANNMSMRSISKLLVQKIRDANKQKKNITQTGHYTNINDGILLIGSSTGGPQTLSKIFPHFPSDIPTGILLVQHMPPIFTKSLAERLDKISQITVKEAQEGDEIKPGLALIAPGGYHMTVQEKTESGRKKRYVSLNQQDRIHGVRPAVDVTFTTAAKIYGKGTVGVILTGMGQDGANSMGLIKAKGGYTIAQDEKTSIIFGMPQAAIKLGVVDSVLPIEQIPFHATQKIKSIIKKAG